MGRVEDRRQGGLATAERIEVHDPGIGCAGLLVDEVLVGGRGYLPPDRARGGRELRQPSVDEAPLERGDERDPYDGERAGNDDRKGQGEARPDAPERIHARAR